MNIVHTSKPPPKLASKPVRDIRDPFDAWLGDVVLIAAMHNMVASASWESADATRWRRLFADEVTPVQACMQMFAMTHKAVVNREQADIIRAAIRECM